MDRYEVEEVQHETDKNIVIKLRGENICYTAMNGFIAVYLDEKTADSIAFHIQSIIQDRSVRYAEKILNK